ncbi:MAG: glycosyl transferase, partial [Actinomycetales bacterium]|nr:glycosyl transferase [Actinomycetales bacterium]
MSPVRERAATVARDVVSLGAIPVTVNLVAASGPVVALLGAPRLVSVLVLAAGLAGVLITSERFRRDKASRRPGLATAVMPRVLVAVGAFAVLARDGVAWPELVAAVLVIGSAFLEAPARRLRTVTFPVVVNMPGVPQREDARVSASKVYLANVLSVALLVAAAAGLTAWVVLVAALGAVGATMVYGLDTFALYRQRRRTENDLAKIVGDYGPEFALHWQAPGGTAYQIGMWLPQLEKLGRKFIVIVRTEVNLRDAQALTDAPIVLRRNLSDLDPLVVPSLKAVFYTNTATRNCHMVRYHELNHIQLNHGDSDKAPSYNPVFRMYDRNFVAGQAAIDRFAANGVPMPEDMFVIVGRPQVEDVEIATKPIREIETPTVLYAPTWSGFYADSNYSSLPAGVTMVKALLARGCQVVFRPHPYARKSDFLKASCAEIIALLEADAAASGRKHVYGRRAEQEMSVPDCFNASDAMISDVSSVVADYLFSEKPMAMAAVSTSPADFPAEFPLAQSGYILDARGGKVPNID